MSTDRYLKQYNNIADDYVKENEERIGKKYLYTPSIFNVLGDIRGKTVFDLACGDGYLTRKLAIAGARQVTGCDISESMIKKAQDEEKNNPLGIKYYIADVAELNKIEEFDIITAAFLLHYASSKEILQNMVTNIFDNLRNGGKFVSLNNNPEQPTNPIKKYGTTIENIGSPLKEGNILKLNMFSLEGEFTCSFDFYYWNKKTYESAFKKAGFKNVKWIPLSVSDEGIKKYSLEFWGDFYKYPTTVIIEAEK